MRVKLQKLPEDDWTCEECMPREGTNKLVQDEVEEAARGKKGCLSESSTGHESTKDSQLKSRSSYAGKSGKNSVSSTAHLSAKRHRVPSEAQSVKKAKAIEINAVSPKSSKPCNNSLLCKDFSCKKVKKVKMKSVNEIVYSVPQRSGDSQEKANVPHASGDRGPVGTLTELNEKGRALKTSIISSKTSNSSNHSLLSREPPSKKLGKAKLDATGSVTSLKQSSNGIKEKEKLPYCLDDELPKLGSQTEIAHDECSLLKSRSSKAGNLKSKGQPAKVQKQKVDRNPAFHDDRKGKGPRTMSKPMSFNSVISGKSNATCSEVLLADAYELHNPATCLLASDSGVTAEKSEKEAVSGGETLFSGPSFCNIDAVESSGRLDHRFQASNHNTLKDPNCPNEKKKNESQQGEHPTKAATVMSMYKLCTDPASDERTHSRDLVQVEEAFVSQGLVIPKAHYTWLGKFQIHSSEGIARTWDGIQAHLSTCASLEVLEVVDRLPEIVILEELPRLRIWPSQFMGSQVTEENIALYFFSHDLDSYKYYAELMDYMIKNDLALKGNLDGVELLIFPSNILPEKSQIWNQMFFFWGVFRGQKVDNSANTSVSNSLKLEKRDPVKSWAFDLNAYPQDGDDMERVDEIPEFDGIGGSGPSGDKILLVGESSNSKGGEANAECAVVDVNLSLWPESETPENCSVGIEDNNVEKPSTSLSLAPPSTALHGKNLDSNDWQLADTLILLSRDKF